VRRRKVKTEKLPDRGTRGGQRWYIYQWVLNQVTGNKELYARVRVGNRMLQKKASKEQLTSHLEGQSV